MEWQPRNLVTFWTDPGYSGLVFLAEITDSHSLSMVFNVIKIDPSPHVGIPLSPNTVTVGWSLQHVYESGSEVWSREHNAV